MAFDPPPNPSCDGPTVEAVGGLVTLAIYSKKFDHVLNDLSELVPFFFLHSTYFPLWEVDSTCVP